MDVLNVNQISKTFGEVPAVKDISFSAQKGRIYGILGPNGAGKTTTIRMIMNILLPDSGNILLFEKPMNEDLKDQLGYLPEERGLYAKMTVLDLLVFLGELSSMTRNSANQSAKNWLKRLELSDWQEKKVEELSKGMQQKIQFIATIMHDPDLIILDEPFSGLDPINSDLIKNIMLELKAREKAIMFSTHMMDVAEKLCDDILLINKGEKILDGKTHIIRQERQNSTIHLEFEGDGDFINSLSMVKNVNSYGTYTEIQIQESFTSQDLLKALVDKITINRWQAKEASLNDIFISLVKGGNDA